MADDRCDLLCLDLAKAEALRAASAVPGPRRGNSRRFPRARRPTRLTIALALRDGGELCVCDLAWISERAENLVSHHVRALRAAGVADYRRDGKMALYSLTAPAARARHDPCRRHRHEHDRQIQRQLRPGLPPHERAALERRAKMLAWGGNAWHVVSSRSRLGLSNGATTSAGCSTSTNSPHSDPAVIRISAVPGVPAACA